MDFNLSKELQMARQLFHDFAVKEVEPWAEETDELHRFPWEAVRKMQKYGFMGIPFPKEIGGQGCDTLTYILAVEEIAKYAAQRLLFSQLIRRSRQTRFILTEQMSKRKNFFAL